jgi:hypothetical protein
VQSLLRARLARLAAAPSMCSASARLLPAVGASPPAGGLVAPSPSRPSSSPVPAAAAVVSSSHSTAHGAGGQREARVKSRAHRGEDARSAWLSVRAAGANECVAVSGRPPDGRLRASARSRRRAGRTRARGARAPAWGRGTSASIGPAREDRVDTSAEYLAEGEGQSSEGAQARGLAKAASRSTASGEARGSARTRHLITRSTHEAALCRSRPRHAQSRGWSRPSRRRMEGG